MQEGKTGSERQLVFVNELVHGGWRQNHVPVTVSLPHLCKQDNFSSQNWELGLLNYFVT